MSGGRLPRTSRPHLLQESWSLPREVQGGSPAGPYRVPPSHGLGLLPDIPARASFRAGSESITQTKKEFIMRFNIQENNPRDAIRFFGILGTWTGSLGKGHRLNTPFTQGHLRKLLDMGYIAQDEDLLSFGQPDRHDPKMLETYYLQAPGNPDTCFLIYRTGDGWFVIS